MVAEIVQPNFIPQLKPFEAGNFPDWLEKFELGALAAGWKEEARKLIMLALHLEMEAFNIFSHLKKKENANYASVISGLKEAFKATEIAYKNKWRVVYKQPTVTFQGYAPRLHRIAINAFSKIPQTAINTMVLDKFFDTISKELRQALFDGQENISIEEVIKKCQKWDAMNVDTQLIQKESLIPHENELKHEIEELKETIEELKISNLEINLLTPRRKYPLKCYRCQKFWHIARFCKSQNIEVLSIHSPIRNLLLTEKIKIEGIHLEGILDTGSNVTILYLQLFKDYFSNQTLDYSYINIRDAQSNMLRVHGQIDCDIEWKKCKNRMTLQIEKDIARPLILGMDFVNLFTWLNNHSYKVEYETCQLNLCQSEEEKSDESYVPFKNAKNQNKANPAILKMIGINIEDRGCLNVGKAKTCAHEIKTISDRPIRFPPRPI